MISESCNCIVCAKEFETSELQSLALSKINITRFKICQDCLDQTNPVNDYREAREIVYSYIKFAETKSLFNEVKDILQSRKP